jgi:hypothetical protein
VACGFLIFGILAGAGAAGTAIGLAAQPNHTMVEHE